MYTHEKRSPTSNDLPAFGWGDLFRAYWFLLDGLKGRWLPLILLLFAINFYVVVPPLLVGKIVDFFTGYHTGDSLRTFYILTAVFGLSFSVVSYLRLSTKRLLGDLQSDVMEGMKVRGFEKLLDFSLAWHLQESAGAKAQRINGGVEAYRSLNKLLQNEIMRSITTALGVVAVFLFLSPKYVVFFFLYIAGFWKIMLFFQSRIQKENDGYYLSLERAGGSYVEGLSNILTIKTFGASTDFKERVAEMAQVTKTHEFKIRIYANGLWKSFQAFNGICYGAFLLLVGLDVVSRAITPGSLVVFYGYLQSLVANASDVMDTYESTINAKSGIGRMMSVFWAKTSIAAGTAQLKKNWQSIRLDHATFTYTNASHEAMKDFSLSIRRGAKIGVVGKTGSGKSTLAKLLAGLYSLSSGTYTIGGGSFYELSHEEQTRAITLVLQETEVFHLTLRENITLLRNIDSELLLQSLAIAQLEDVVAALPEGLETLVGEKGYHLSGGERQRVGIARAICRNAPILILDEATSSLDRKTELAIQEALEQQLKDRTVISIAHRVATLEHTDEVLVLDDGAIVERGQYAQLLSNRASVFYELSHGQKHPTSVET